MSPTYAALDGEGARRVGGRWNPKGGFPAVYTSLDVGTAALEIQRTASKLGVQVSDLLPRRLVEIEFDLAVVLDLTDPVTLAAAGLSLAVLTDDDLRICQAIGDAAHYMGFEAIRAQSAAGPGFNLTIFPNRVQATSRLEVVAAEAVAVDDLT